MLSIFTDMNGELENIIPNSSGAETKKCKGEGCGIKPLSEFKLMPNLKYGRDLYCKACRKIITANSYRKVKERRLKALAESNTKIDETQLKQCRHQDCLKFKPLSDFRKGITYADGYKSWCRECETAYVRTWRKENTGYVPPKRKKVKRKPRVPRPKKDYGEYGRPIHAILEPALISEEELIKENIRLELKRIKRGRIQSPVSIIPHFDLEKFLSLNLIKRTYCDNQYFLGVRTKYHYSLPDDRELLSLDDTCHGEPSSSYKDFLSLRGDNDSKSAMREILESRNNLSEVA